ncbi:hypothetical protein BVG19_g2061 [[Candida] boidinii]|nr:hypothetical protein BVG19_g2061 [[Candida] boidinii]OWB48818.1 hypothetical protein B5S27_g355 [[Candida] boidinii]
MQKSSLLTNSSCVLYLGTIPYNWDVEIIKSVVCGSGPVVDVRCMMDNASKNKGFCFVEYATPLDAQRALRLLSQIKIEGRKKLRIEISKEGLRNPTPGAKPELQLNRNYLPSNVILPPEMLMNNPQPQPQQNQQQQQQQPQQQLPLQQQQQQQFIQRSLLNQNPQSQQQQPQFNSPNDLIAAVSSSPQLQQIVTQLISNGMDINQITTVIQQFTSNNGVKNPLQPQSQPPQQQQQFMGNNQFQPIPTNTVNPNNQQHNENNPIGGIILPQQDNTTQLNHNQQPQQGNLGIPHHLMNASQYLAMNPQQHFLQQQQQQMHGQIPQQQQPQQIPPISTSPLAIKDKVSETLSTIAPGVLIELLTELKITLNGPQPNAGKAAQILHENPKLAVAAGQALLLMGIIDMDSINKTLNDISTTSPTDVASQQQTQTQRTSVSPSSLASTSSTSNTSNALPLHSDSNPNNLQQMQQQQQLIDNFNPLASNNIAIATNPNTISNTQTPINNNISNNSTFIHQPIPRNSANNINNSNNNNDNLSSSSTPNSLNSTSSPITTVTPPINGLPSSSSSATSLASNNQHNNMQQIPMNTQQQQQQLPLQQQPIQQQQQSQQQLNDKNIAQYSSQVINPDWIGLSPNTISKLQTISNNEASLIVQVLKLSNQQIDNLPENEKRMAIQIRNQYL